MRGLDLYLSRLNALRLTGRLEELHRYYPFSSLNYACVVILNSDGDRDEHIKLTDRFEIHEYGWPRDKRRRAYWARLLVRLSIVLRQLRALVRTRRLQLVTAYDPHMLGIFGLLVSVTCRIPFRIRLVRNHALDHEYFDTLGFPPFKRRWVERAVEKFVIRRAAQVLVYCPNHAEMVRSYGVDEDRIYPYVYAQDPYFYEETEPHRLPDGFEFVGKVPTVVVVSRLVRQKFVEDVIPLARRCRELIPDIRFVVLGDGPLQDVLEQQVKEESAPVVLAGVFRKETVAAFLRSASCVFIPQGAGIVTEAALQGARIVTYDFEMNPFVVGRDYPFVVPARDIEKAAQAIVSVCAHPDFSELWRRLQTGTRRRFNPALAQEAERWALRSLATGVRDGRQAVRELWGARYGEC